MAVMSDEPIWLASRRQLLGIGGRRLDRRRVVNRPGKSGEFLF